MADKDMSALAGDATPVTALPSRKHITTAVATLTTILPSALGGKNVVEFEDEFEPEFEDMFVTKLIVDFVVRTGAVVLTFV